MAPAPAAPELTISASHAESTFLRAFTPGLTKEYSAGMTATVISSAGDAAPTVAGFNANAPGHLVNGAFSLPQPLKRG